ncbi:MAG: GrrA/OscA1 family cyclophane-containing rSAM-modified RiPP [Steroidobacteraceae bacterium]
MAEWNRLFKALSVVLPAGAFGASVLLALAATEASAVSNSNQPTKAPPPTSQESVSTRLQAIRSGVSDMTGSASFDPEGGAKATPAWWGNGGWGRWHPGWGNGGGWRNGGWGNGGWGNGWHNGGWGNGGWHNGGWGNGWHNFWHNW